MAISLSAPRTTELKPRIVVFGVGGAGGNAVNNMIEAGLEGVEFVVANTDAQQLQFAKTDRRIQLGVQITQGLGAGAHPEVGMSAAEESFPEIGEHLDGAHMVFITAGMGGGTGTGAAPIIAKCARERGILTVGVVTKPFHFEGRHRMRLADAASGPAFCAAAGVLHRTAFGPREVVSPKALTGAQMRKRPMDPNASPVAKAAAWLRDNL